ncbi:hypothetical protein TNCV_2397721 [Trichonephila clavipes]|uniref:Uncharacterized protein n=1 Tax=Trichonephila clavipes TaxID=2585209 RepID=A0A8X6T273_TRICX|nr:hypothetical protein TNCV_2397721 [Trichonephila clavipes]
MSIPYDENQGPTTCPPMSDESTITGCSSRSHAGLRKVKVANTGSTLSCHGLNSGASENPPNRKAAAC